MTPIGYDPASNRLIYRDEQGTTVIGEPMFTHDDVLAEAKRMYWVVANGTIIEGGIPNLVDTPWDELDQKTQNLYIRFAKRNLEWWKG